MGTRTYLLFINTNEKEMVPSLYEGPMKGCKRLDMDWRHYCQCCRDDGTACVHVSNSLSVCSRLVDVRDVSTYTEGAVCMWTEEEGNGERLLSRGNNETGWMAWMA